MTKNSDTTSQKSETALREEEVLSFWKEQEIFEKSVSKEAPQGEFVFYDGPPFATGLPHMGSLLSSVIKDVIPRYKTMRGYRVDRRWGWDCHGLPIETLIEKRLELKTRKDIEKIGLAAFNEAARASVLEFEHEWEKYIDRVGRFVDFRHSYKTMDNSYIESVWWGLKELHKKGLLYEGRRVLMYCPHDETVLAKAEIAMDDTYKDITEEAVTVKFKIIDPKKHGFPDHTYMLAWTTTPWTLPGNVALAIGKDIEYVLAKHDKEHVILAKERAEGVTAVSKVMGSDLVGVEYEPLFKVPALHSEKSYRVYPADFVTTGEGTGIVHTAVMYGEDDFALGQKEKLPMVQLLDGGAHYNENAPEFIRGKYIKQAEKFIKEDLESRALLFAREMHTHSYPHCYRCGTALIYNAVASWFIDIQKIKAKMLSENEEINWVPDHLKHGRFQHIVENAPDWTISRNRFWASPLPIWKERGGNKLMVIGSLEELKQRVKKSGNRYFVMRHGEANHMLAGVYTTDPHDEHPLTELGREQAKSAAAKIPTDKPIVIVSSPVLRARQTAEIVGNELGVDVIFDERLREMEFGIFDGKSKEEYKNFIERPDWYTAAPEQGESFEMIKTRFGQALYEYEQKYQDHTVLMVSHAIAFESLLPICEGLSGRELLEFVDALSFAQPAEVLELSFTPLPLNKKFELDFHRPYIDSIVLVDEDGHEYERIPEVVDCWVESGVMPFAQWHYPFESEYYFKEHFPGDFIAEYIAQTRTWFYYLHAMGVGLFDSHAFRNVVSTGTILAADGAKMSKSKGNYTDPLELMDRYGADATRFTLMGSVVMQAEDLKFRDDDVRQIHSRVIGILWNSYKFFELYKNEYDGVTRALESIHPLDRWILSRLGQTVRIVTDAFETYTMPPACRELRQFIDDYSTWYLRRSRDRVKNEGKDKQYALATQQEVLITLSKLLAPITPFIAESIYKGAGGKKESVHLAWWPQEYGVDEKLLTQMQLARTIASAGLELRDKAGIKVRQPLSLLEVKTIPESDEIQAIVAEELNVKKIVHNSELQEEIWLNTEITPELKEEGVLRTIVRVIQEMRKEKGLTVSDRPILTVSTDTEGQQFFDKYREYLLSHTNLSDLHIEEGEGSDMELFKAKLELK